MINLHDQISEETYYKILSVEETATHEEIRARYKASILLHHPDKIPSNHPTQDPHDSRERFMKIQAAWEVLGDEDSRAAYDRELKIMKSDPVIYYQEIEIKDMIFRERGDEAEFVFPCRCGDFFSLSGDEVREMGFRVDGSRVSRVLDDDSMEPVSVVISCSSCSLMISLTIDSNS